MWAENWRASPLFGEGLGPHLTQSRLAEAYLHGKGHLDPSSRLTTINLGRKFGALPPFWGGEARSPSNTKSPGPRLPPYHVASWSIQPFGHNRYGQKIGGRGLCPFGWGGAGSLSNIMWPVPRPTCMPSFILIYPAVCPHYTNVIDRQTGQTDHVW